MQDEISERPAAKQLLLGSELVASETMVVGRRVLCSCSVGKGLGYWQGVWESVWCSWH